MTFTLILHLRCNILFFDTHLLLLPSTELPQAVLVLIILFGFGQSVYEV